MKKRILSLFLALGLLLSLLPTAALAVGRGTEADPVPAEEGAAPVEAESTEAVRGGGGGGVVWHSAFEGHALLEIGLGVPNDLAQELCELGGVLGLLK